MKGNTFQMWLKEFCALVFTQTVQAFILAIVLTLVVIILSTDSEYESVTKNQAAGVMAIIALTSISKLEGVVKKFFGVDSSLTDTSMNGGKSGIVGTMMAMKLGKRVFDNGKKFAGGLKGAHDAKRDMKKNKLDYEKAKYKALDRFNKKYPESSNQNLTTGQSGSTTTTSSSFNGGGLGANGINGLGAGVGNGAGTGGNGNTGNGTVNGGNVTITNSNVNMGSGNSGGKSKEADYDAKMKLEDNLAKIKEDYQKKQEEAKQKLSQSRKSYISGVTETVGAVGGFGAGAVYGMGTGDSILKNAVSGMGIGDMLGQKAVDIPYGAKDFVRAELDARRTLKDYNNNLAGTINEINKLKRDNAIINEMMTKFDAGDI